MEAYGFNAPVPAAFRSDSVVAVVDKAAGRAGTLGAAEKSVVGGVDAGVVEASAVDEAVVEDIAAPPARSQGLGGEGIVVMPLVPQNEGEDNGGTQEGSGSHWSRAGATNSPKNAALASDSRTS